MVDKIDQLRLCNEQNEPFQDFSARWCARCFQPECTRSQHGKSSFESRVVNWEKRLFTEVPRLNPEDERFSKITAQRFVAVGVGPAHVASAWLDPKDLGAAEAKQSDPEPEKVEAPRPAAVAPEPKPETQPVETKREVVPPGQPPPMNTPNRPRQMVGGATPPAPQPVLDPWQPKQPLKPGEALVEKGAKIRFRGQS